ncbi:hypothetical protein BKA70DRAFT_1508919 [Coprinopsis sp. MPI-PUGE-AT-0042]|nr:hypothetical protein BKA70DRAFT_1508919 [Coprinopsis sp. MPI-PUGE-AT-0042]
MPAIRTERQLSPEVGTNTFKLSKPSSNQNNKKRSAPAPKNIKCSDCDEHFSRGDTARRHWVRHHSGEPAPYECEFCAKPFWQKSNMATHLRSQHAPLQEPKFGCTYVNADPALLSRHFHGTSSRGPCPFGKGVVGVNWADYEHLATASKKPAYSRSSSQTTSEAPSPSSDDCSDFEAAFDNMATYYESPSSPRSSSASPALPYLTQYQDLTLPEVDNEASLYKDGVALSNWMAPQLPTDTAFSALQWYPEAPHYVHEAPQQQDRSFQPTTEADEAFFASLQWSLDVAEPAPATFQQEQWPIQAAAEAKEFNPLDSTTWGLSTSWEEFCLENGISASTFNNAAFPPEMLAHFEATLSLCGPASQPSPLAYASS